eukprot:Hpha_TRINITY_DN1434_c0_g1::TRINITY_DN1434_c0_g1_i1::g.9579::m.9579
MGEGCRNRKKPQVSRRDPERGRGFAPVRTESVSESEQRKSVFIFFNTAVFHEGCRAGDCPLTRRVGDLAPLRVLVAPRRLLSLLFPAFRPLLPLPLLPPAD